MLEKIELRNIFDQYSQPENRITHALLTGLNLDRQLLGHFLRQLVRVKTPVTPTKLIVLEQQYPGEAEPREDELEKRGNPDGWIFDEDSDWCVFIESKVLMKPNAEQIRRHYGSAARRDFRRVTAVVIAPQPPANLGSDVVPLEWREVYRWLRSHAHESTWAKEIADYFEVAEAKMIDDAQFLEGTLTMFSGFRFGPDHPFTYLEGKRTLSLALRDLRSRRDLQKLGMNPEIPGRPAITGRQSDRVWNFLSLSSSTDVETFTKYPHLTLAVTVDDVEAMVTVPNRVNGTMRRNLKELGEDGFRRLAAKILTNLRPLLRAHQGASPLFKGIQRRYPSQRAAPIVDAEIKFDLRTAVEGGPPKSQPSWLSAAYQAFAERHGANYQIQIGIIFPYSRCPEIQKAGALSMVARSWLACKPLIDLSR